MTDIQNMKKQVKKVKKQAAVDFEKITWLELLKKDYRLMSPEERLRRLFK